MITQETDSQKDKAHIIKRLSQKQLNPHDQSNRLLQGPCFNKDQDVIGEFNTSMHNLNTSISSSTHYSGSSSLSPTSINTLLPSSSIVYTSSAKESKNNKFVDAYLKVCIFYSRHRLSYTIQNIYYTRAVRPVYILF